MIRLWRSLPVRQALLTGTWVAIGLILMWLFVSEIVSSATERSFDARLVALLDSLTAATTLSGGRPTLLRPVSEPRFDRPLSGSYFQIQGPTGLLLVSRSLGDQLLPEGRFGHTTVLIDDITGPRGEHLRRVERDIILPTGGGVIHVIVAQARDNALADAARTRRELGVDFALLGMGLVASVALQAWLGLGGLKRLRGVVAELRAGGQIDPTLRLPLEVQPLLAEIDALVQQNRATVDRARLHVGNLAHALRTHLAIMRNALAVGDISPLGTQLEEADRLVQHHLVRARGAALAGSAARLVMVSAVAEEIAQALRVLFHDRHLAIEVRGEGGLQAHCDREDLAEMLGNLAENACKWAATRVEMTVRLADGAVIVAVSDDGAGLPPDSLVAVQQRGVRLDERVVGTGLGLAIVRDLVGLYGGSLELRSPGVLGGLTAELCLAGGVGRG